MLEEEEEEEQQNSEKQFYLSYQSFYDYPIHASFDVLPAHTVYGILGSGTAEEKYPSLHEKVLVFHLPEN